MGHEVYHVVMGGLNIPVNGKMQCILGEHDINNDHVLDTHDFSAFYEAGDVVASAYFGAAKASGYPCDGLSLGLFTKFAHHSTTINRAYHAILKNNSKTLAEAQIDCKTTADNARASNIYLDDLFSDASLVRAGGSYLNCFKGGCGTIYRSTIHITIPEDISPELQNAWRHQFYRAAYVHFHTAGQNICDEAIDGPKERNYLISECSSTDLNDCKFVPLLPLETDQIYLWHRDLEYTGIK